MKTSHTHIFNSENYPRATACIRKDYYRLQEFIQGKKEDESKKIEGELWTYVWQTALSKKPCAQLENYKYLGSGWEWSAFLDLDRKVIKVPAGIFPEVGTKEYFNNIMVAHDLIVKYFGTRFVAKTAFNYPYLTQEYIEGKNNFVIGYNTQNIILLENLSKFLDQALSMIAKEEWLPDFDIKRQKGGFKLANVIIEKRSFLPKIIDFSAYYDIYRMYPARTTMELKSKTERVMDFKQWTERRIKNYPSAIRADQVRSKSKS